jgi:NADPH:quinone reductase-like Zn-dependent oxidoreductase
MLFSIDLVLPPVCVSVRFRARAPGSGEALVRVFATSLNPVDYKVAAQGYEGWNYPHVLGVDVAGVIETLGEGVNSWSPGERVFYHASWRRDGSYAEFNVAPAHTSPASRTEPPSLTLQHCLVRA